jgi:hypothetical protein
VAFFLCAYLAIVGTASADLLYDLFTYDEPVPPVSGDCAAMGPAVAWHGEFSGKRKDGFTDKYLPYAARGCFESVGACRYWQHQAVTYLDGGPLYYTLCRPGAPPWLF